MTISPVKIWRRARKNSTLIGKRGVLVCHTIIRVAPNGFSNQSPYPVVIVKLNQGETVIGQLVDYEEGDLTVGREVVAVLRRVLSEDKEGVIPYCIKFKPA